MVDVKLLNKYHIYIIIVPLFDSLLQIGHKS